MQCTKYPYFLGTIKILLGLILAVIQENLCSKYQSSL